MSLAGSILVFTFVWLFVYLIYHFLKLSNTRPLLPSLTSSRAGHRRVWKEPGFHVALKGFHLQIQTTSWNASHDFLATFLRKQPRARLLMRFYDLGSLVASIGMVGALSLLGAANVASFLFLFQKLRMYAVREDYASQESTGALISALIRRDFGAHIGRVSPVSEIWVKPVIPGLTVPLSHLPIMLLAVFLGQIIHEFGHVIAAALESIPLLSAGVSFTVIVPSAFVKFSEASLGSLADHARRRVIAAGPFHNALAWSLLMLVGYLELSEIFWAPGYRNISTIGVAVVEVDSQSPLFDHLPSGSLIIAIDDSSLASQNDLWYSILVQRKREQTLGWCVQLMDEEDSCCLHNRNTDLSCFANLDNPTVKGCLNPIPILTSTSNATRCSTSGDCPSTSICVRPVETEQLLRLTVDHGLDSKQQIVLWKGPFEEVWEAVKVSSLLPRFSFISASLPLWAKMFWEYLLMAMLSLYFFNMLPLPYFDGSQFLSTILCTIQDFPPNEYELEALDHSQDRQLTRRRWQARMHWFTLKFTLALCMSCVVLIVINAYL